MTSDPIADMLTRVRNAIQARHPKVDVPASKLKAEIARILKEEGYIANFKVAEEGVKKTIKIYLKYGQRQPAGDLRHRARLTARVPRVCRPDGHPARAGRHGDQHPDHRPRSDDRPRRPQREESAAKFCAGFGKWRRLCLELEKNRSRCRAA